MSLPKSAPRKVGRYRLLAPIARGGAATVYLGRSEGIGGFARIVAVKLLHPHLLEDAASQASNEFIEEAKLSARMQHPMIVPVMDVGQSEDGFYLVMDYVDGASLSEVMKQCNPLPRGIALRILSDVLQGLHAAHTAKDEKGRDLGIVHRDFSPQNILVGTDGRSRLTDFGIARATTRAEYTRTGLVKGKVAYMSPEQAEGKALDARTDVWAAGVVAWEMFSAKRMYPRMDPMPMMLRIINDAPPRLVDVCPDVEPALSQALAQALERDATARLKTAAELRVSILTAAGGEAAMASPEEVGEFVVGLKIKRLDELRAIVQDASESRSAAPPPRDLPAAGSEPPTRVEPNIARAETGTFATTSAEMSAAGSTTSMMQAFGRRRRLWAALAIAGAVLAVAGTILLSTSDDLIEAPRVKAPETKATIIDGAQAAPTEPPDSIEQKTDTETNNAPAPHEVAEEAEDLPAQRSEISIVANEPFLSLKIGKRTVVLPSPTNSASIRLLDSEQLQTLTIEIATIDGRKASTTLAAEAIEAGLEFPKLLPRPVRRPTTRTSAPSTPKKKSGLAASPY